MSAPMGTQERELAERYMRRRPSIACGAFSIVQWYSTTHGTAKSVPLASVMISRSSPMTSARCVHDGGREKVLPSARTL